MKTLQRSGSLLRAGALALSVLATAAATGCAAGPSYGTEMGSVQLPTSGVAGKGTRYLLRGTYTLQHLDDGSRSTIYVDPGPDGMPVRRDLPAGRYAVSLNPGFEIEWVSRPRPTEGVAPAIAWDGPKLVVIERGKLATVELRSKISESLAMR